MVDLNRAADLVVMKETLEYFRKLGFSDQYVEEIEQDLLQHERKLAEILREEDE